MLDRLGEIYKVPVYETPVGFKYVAPVMIAQNALIGGEESGGYGFRGHIPERDAIPSGLYFLDFMVKTGKTPSQLLAYLYSKVGEHYYDRIDLHFPEEKRQAIINRVQDNAPKSIENVKIVRLDTQDGFRFILADNSWLLIRFSGTEPILRIYAETNDTERVKRILQFGRELAALAGKQGRTGAQMAIAWNLRRPEVTSALTGPRTPSEIEDTSKAADWQLTKENIAAVEALLAKRQEKIRALQK